MLKVDNINVYYGAIHAIKNVSFQVNEGEIVTLIGANGAGKSTILKTISGLLHTKTDSVSFQDHNLKSAPPHKIVEMGIAHVPEGRRVFSRMSVEENLEMGAFTQPNDSVNAAIEHVYERFPRLKERRKQVAGTLSGGEQQMLAMGRALMSRPKLMMLDEPSMGLAPILVDQIFDIVKEPVRRYYPPCGAECTNGSLYRKPGLCSGNRQDSPLLRCGRTSPQRRRQESISWRLGQIKIH